MLMFSDRLRSVFVFMGFDGNFYFLCEMLGVWILDCLIVWKTCLMCVNPSRVVD